MLVNSTIMMRKKSFLLTRWCLSDIIEIEYCIQEENHTMVLEIQRIKCTKTTMRPSQIILISSGWWILTWVILGSWAYIDLYLNRLLRILACWKSGNNHTRQLLDHICGIINWPPLMPILWSYLNVASAISIERIIKQKLSCEVFRFHFERIDVWIIITLQHTVTKKSIIYWISYLRLYWVSN